MNSKNKFFSSLNCLAIMATMIFGLLVSSCTKEELDSDAKVISFTNNSLMIDQELVHTLTVDLTLSDALEADGAVVISVDSTSTVVNTDYTIDPAPVSGLITLNLLKGATEASFTVTLINPIIDNKVLVFKLTSASGDVVLPESGLTATLTVKNNTPVEPTITASVSSFDDFGTVNNGIASESKSYTVTGTNLTTNLTVTASSNFRVSLDNTVFNNVLTINNNEFKSGPVTVYVQFLPGTGNNQNLTGTITNSSAGAIDKVITVSGTEAGNSSSVLLIEDFNYGNTVGNLTSITTNWTKYSGDSSFVKYVYPGLSFPGYSGSGVGGAAKMENGSGNREDISRSFSAQSTGVLYTAQIINMKNASPEADRPTGDFFISLRDEAGGYFGRIYAKSNDGTNLILGFRKNAKATLVFSETKLNFNTSYLLVTKYEFSTKMASFYIFQTNAPATEPSVPDLVSADATDSDAPSFVNIIVRQGAGIIDCSIDGIRVANTWKDVLGL